MKPIRVVQVGLGPIGRECVRALATKTAVEIAGGVDLDPKFDGLDLGEACELPEKLGVPVQTDLEKALREWQPQVVVHTTSSFLEKIEEQITTIIRAGAHVVSATEELFYPFTLHPEFSDRIDSMAQHHQIVVVGTGVNPGFAMDVLPLTLTGICTRVEKVTVYRVVDSGQRRVQLLKKTGAGLSQSEFQERLAAGQFGHIGLRESALAVMHTLNWTADSIAETISPVITDRAMATADIKIDVDAVTGLHQVLQVREGEVVRVVLDLKIHVGPETQYDRVEIVGDPPINMQIEGGLFGDTATVGALVNTIPRLHNVPPGLRSMIDLSIPHAF